MCNIKEPYKSAVAIMQEMYVVVPSGMRVLPTGFPLNVAINAAQVICESIVNKPLTYLLTLKQEINKIFTGTNACDYSFENLRIGGYRELACILGAAYYALVLSDSFDEHELHLIEKIMTKYERHEIPPYFNIFKEAAMKVWEHKQKHLWTEAEKPQDVAEPNLNASDGEVSELQTCIAELEGENANLPAEVERLQHGNEQLMQEGPVREIDEQLRTELDRLKKLHEDMLVELLKPVFYNIEEDARRFLRRIEGLDNQGVTDVARQFLKENKITPSKKGRPIWLYLHAAKLYTATEQNWTAAMRKEL